MYYYALSDIHGYLDILEDSMKLVDLDGNNKVFFLGDYIDYGNDSCKVLYYIKNLVNKYKNKVVVLMGNHEEMFLEWLVHPIEYVQWLLEDKEFRTTKTFLTNNQLNEVYSQTKNNKDIYYISKLVAKMIIENHRELILWLQKLPYYYQTDKQIFVHAGIDEEAEDLWRYGTPKEYFTNKFPAQFGTFYKDIISGHIGANSLRKNKECYNIFFDGKSHYYIDGTTKESKTIPVLKYNVKNNKYTSFRKKNNTNEWEEYSIRKEEEQIE